MTTAAGPTRPPERPRRGRRHGRLLLVVGGAGLLALVLAVNPRSLGSALHRVGLGPLPVLAALSLGVLALQGLRWHQLLGAAGSRLPLGDSLLYNTAGQATGLLPLGELTRVLLVADATGLAFGAVLATVTVQELVYTAALIVVAIPAAVARGALIAPLAAGIVFVAAVFVLLGSSTIWKFVDHLIGKIPQLRRALPPLGSLQSTTARLLRRGDTALWSLVSLAGAVLAVTLLWRVVEAVSPGVIGWRTAALVYTASHLAGAVSAIPGGLGAYEASVTGLLVAAGVDFTSATAVALLHRAADKGLQSVVGLGAMVMARRRGGRRRRSAESRAGRGLAEPEASKPSRRAAGVDVVRRGGCG